MYYKGLRHSPTEHTRCSALHSTESVKVGSRTHILTSPHAPRGGELSEGAMMATIVFIREDGEISSKRER